MYLQGDDHGNNPGYHQQHFPSPDLPPSSSDLQDPASEQSYQQYNFLYNQQQKQQQLQQLLRARIQLQNGNLLPNNVIGGFERSNPNGNPEQNYNNFQRTEPQQVFGNVNFNVMPNYQNQIPAMNNTTQYNGAEIHLRKVEKLLMEWTMMAQSFEDRVLEHQNNLTQMFMKRIEEIEKERNEREAKREQEAAAAHAGILSYLEKLAGEKIQVAPAVVRKGRSRGEKWPEEDLKALIELRAQMEGEFKEKTGRAKAALWEKMSAEMGKLGLKRDAKRCKEKWENILKYYSKKKSGKGKGVKKSSPSKTCAYFKLLNEYYSPEAVPPPEMDSSVDPSSQMNNAAEHPASTREMMTRIELS